MLTTIVKKSKRNISKEKNEEKREAEDAIHILN
jgi:hypothetical protein